MSGTYERSDWCLLLANACSPSFPDAACQALEAMLPLLADWDDGYFTIETARAIACAKRRQIIPALDEINAAFMARDAARRAALPPPAPPLRLVSTAARPSAAERQRIAAEVRQAVAALRAG